MKRTRLSLFYLAGYLFPAGILLMVAPDLAFKLTLSNGQYGDVMPRFLGMMLIGLGIIVSHMIWKRAEAVYSSTLMVRVFFCASFIPLYLYSRDPLFLVLLGVVGFGMVLTGISFILDGTGSAARRER